MTLTKTGIVLSISILSVVAFFYLSNSNKEAIIFNGKNAYEYPVWEEMIRADMVNLADLDAAFNAYASTHELDYMTIKEFKKLKKRFQGAIDLDGNFRSMGLRFEELMEYRKAKANDNAPEGLLKYDLSQASFAMDIPNSTNSGSWKCIGPFGNPEIQWSATGNGAMDYIEMHPTDPATMYSCARNGGLWKTTNYGKNWVSLTSHFATPHTSCVDVNKGNPSVLYLGAKQDKMIWYTNDEGATWHNRSTGIDGEVFDVHSDPLDATRAIASTTAGVYLTTDSGVSWTQKISGKFTDMRVSDAMDFMCISKDAANTPSTLFFSKDKGTTWIEHTITTSPATVDRFHVAIHEPAVGAIKVFAYGIDVSNTPSRFIGLWKGDYDPAGPGGVYFNFTEVKHPSYAYPNGAATLQWTAAAPGYAELGDGYGNINPFNNNTWASDFWVSDNDPNRLLTQAEKMWGSDDGGIIWDRKPSYGGSNWADMRFMTTNIAQDSVFWCNDGGLWAIREDDLFPTPAEVAASGFSKEQYIINKVVPKNGDICVSEGSQMDISQMSKDVFMTGGQDIGQIYQRSGRATHVASADIYRGRIKPSDDSKFHTGALKVKLDGGTDVYEVYNSIEADRFNSDRMYGFTTKNATTNMATVKLVRSVVGNDSWLVDGFYGEFKPNPGGSSWTPTHDAWETVDISSTGITTQKEHTFEQSRANADVGFMGDELGKKLFVTNNLSNASPTWSQLTTAPAASRYRIATHPYNENVVALATDKGIYLSKDKGLTWHSRGTFPETNPLFIILDKTQSEGVYVMTEQNVYHIDENMTEWAEFNKGLPLMLNTDMRIGYYDNGDNRLYVSKYGRGVWSSPLQSVLDANGDKPIVDFKVHGSNDHEVNVGGKVKLEELTLNAETLSWVIENGGDVINVGNVKSPTVTLNTAGYYKVTLTGTNANGSASKVKEYYLKVNAAPVTSACTPVDTETLAYNKGFNFVQVGQENLQISTKKSYWDSEKIFRITSTETPAIHGENSLMRVAIYIDYDNDGSFSASEKVYDAGGGVYGFNHTLNPPASVVKNVPLRVRVAGKEGSGNLPSSCEDAGVRQSIDTYLIIFDEINFTSTTSNILSVNSASLTTVYNTALNVKKAGFVYSTFDGDLNLDNSTVIDHIGALGNNDTYTSTINELDFSKKYYYRAYVIDDNEVHYGPKMNLELAPYKIPLSESIIALHMEDNMWRFTGAVYPEGHILTSVSIEHGETSYTNSTPIDISGESATINFDVETTVNIAPSVTDYQYRIKLVLDGKNYYSNVIKLKPNQNICVPTVNSSPWYKRFNAVEMDGINHTEPQGEPPYEDASQVMFNLNQGGTHTLTATGTYSGWHNLTYNVYIDLNNDNDFNDDHELVGSSDPIASHITPISLMIPSTRIVTGRNLKMRVVGIENGQVDPCATPIHSGNIKDFTAYIKPTSTPIKIHLQGPYAGALMNDQLRSASPVLIPTTEPYTALGYTHLKGGGGETCDASVFAVTGNDAIVDWVYVELRSKDDATKVTNTRAALIQRDGDIVDVDGVSDLGFRYAEPDDYYVVVKHRNHLGIRTAGVVSLSSTTAKYDFTTSQAMAYKPMSHPNEPMADLGGGVYGMYGGNSNGDGFVKMTGSSSGSNDYLQIIATLGGSTNAQIGVYTSEDLNMDGNVRMSGASPVSNDYLKLINALGGSTNFISKTIN